MMVSSSRNSIFCSCDRNHGGFDYSIKIVTQQDGKIRYIRKSRYFDNFIRQINDGKNYLGKKEVLLGDMGVGKTSLVLRFVKGQFSEMQESTIGAAFFTQVLSLNEATIKFDIWDTAGQERYHSLAPMYYRSAAAVIVVYDIISMESFARAKKWVQKMQRHANPSLIMFLVANKANLGAERKVTNEEGEEYAKENELSFLETSAKTAQNVNELFYEIEKGLAKANPSHQTGIKLHIIPQETRRRSLFCCV
ncbi:ras-related protein RHN1-like isoform X1 [Arachis ipaensis]|uniref:ras-related protein RHN1-like isoform X1 n=1 Tax=Arachis ipaensis TaxID=130454 RepID=UPI000A2B5D6C|nr:ras-related protein RHN1-like isoform X1 [Arachis ipaensis]XP_025671081.1 ras-related protein RHN1 isoform X2 [Arachis hypogaea]